MKMLILIVISLLIKITYLFGGNVCGYFSSKGKKKDDCSLFLLKND